MLRLFLNTSNKYLYICLLDGTVIEDEVLLEGNNNHSEKLIDVLADFLNKNHLSTDDIDEIYCELNDWEEVKKYKPEIYNETLEIYIRNQIECILEFKVNDELDILLQNLM